MNSLIGCCRGDLGHSSVSVSGWLLLDECALQWDFCCILGLTFACHGRMGFIFSEMFPHTWWTPASLQPWPPSPPWRVKAQQWSQQTQLVFTTPISHLHLTVNSLITLPLRPFLDTLCRTLVSSKFSWLYSAVILSPKVCLLYHLLSLLDNIFECRGRKCGLLQKSVDIFSELISFVFLLSSNLSRILSTAAPNRLTPCLCPHCNDGHAPLGLTI